MEANDDAGNLMPRGALRFSSERRPEPARSYSNRGKRMHRDLAQSSVGASLLAMVVNDNAISLTPRGVLRFFASRLAPTVIAANACIAILPRAL